MRQEVWCLMGNDHHRNMQCRPKRILTTDSSHEGVPEEIHFRGVKISLHAQKSLFASHHNMLCSTWVLLSHFSESFPPFSDRPVMKERMEEGRSKEGGRQSKWEVMRGDGRDRVMVPPQTSCANVSARTVIDKEVERVIHDK